MLPFLLRLQEYGVTVIATAPTVPYKGTLPDTHLAEERTFF